MKKSKKNQSMDRIAGMGSTEPLNQTPIQRFLNTAGMSALKIVFFVFISDLLGELICEGLYEVLAERGGGGGGEEAEIIWLDPFLLSLIISPAVWFAIVRPLRGTIERQREEMRWRAEMQDRMRNIFNTSGDPMWLTSRNYTIIDVNDAFLQLLGRAREDVIGMSGDILFPKPDGKRSTSAKRIFEELVDRIEEDVVRDMPNGQQRYFIMSAVPLRNASGQIVGLVENFKDITMRQEAEDQMRRAKEAAEETARAKANFLASMSHEIRTPMNGVLGMSNLLTETTLTDEQLEYVQTINTSGALLMSILSDILDFSKIDAGRMEIENHSFDPAEGVEDTVAMFAGRAQEQQNELVCRIEDGVPELVRSDSTRFRQIISNLVGNALKFTSHGEVLVRLAPETHAETGKQMLRVDVRDTGIGISEDKLEHVFEFFTQADTSTTRNYGGTGLGLAISKSLTEMLGGEITVTSEEGKGSTFSFTIIAEAVEVPKRRDESQTIGQLSKKKILIVDNNETNLLTLKTQCERWGMEVYTSIEGGEALHKLMDSPPMDVAIIDLQMPGMNGEELSRKIREAGHQMPLIMLSAATIDETHRSKHFFRLLHKPARTRSLLESLAQALDASLKEKAEAAKPHLDQTLGERYPMRILLTEDNKVNQVLALRILKKMGYKADLAENGQEAINALERGPYDMIFMDIFMPVMDGIEAVTKIRSSNRVYRDVHIVAMTANALPGAREECLDAGMNGYITKPLALDDMQNAIKAFVQDREAYVSALK